ncbi:MAG TPA: hypothetical protein VF529_12415 [Solirubrobacteraceae bacterium]
MLDRLPDGEANPPLYSGLAWAWAHVFGDGEAGLRSLSALAGTALVVVAWAAARTLVAGAVAGTERRAAAIAGVLTALLVATNPMLVWYSQEARAYALLTLLAGLSALLLASLLRRASSPPARYSSPRPSSALLAGWAACGALMVLTHYFAVFLLAAEAAVLLWRLPAERGRVIAASFAWIAAGLAVLPLAAEQGDDSRASWIGDEPLGERVADVARELATANTALISSNSPAPGGVYWVPAVLGLAIGIVACVAGRRALRGSGVALVAGAAGASLAVPLLLALTPLDFFKDRNLIAAWPIAAVALGAALALRASPRLAAVAGAAVAAAGVLVCVAVARDEELQRADWRGALASLRRDDVPRAIVVQPAYAHAPLRFYDVNTRPLVAGTGVRELVVVGTEALPERAPASLGRLRLVERWRRRQIGFVRYRAAAGLERLDDRALRASPGLLYQPSAAARRWGADVAAAGDVWRRAAAAGQLGDALRRDLAATARRAPALADVPEEVADAPELARRIRAIAKAAEEYAREGTPEGRDALREALAALTS